MCLSYIPHAAGAVNHHCRTGREFRVANSEIRNTLLIVQLYERVSGTRNNSTIGHHQSSEKKILQLNYNDIIIVLEWITTLIITFFSVPVVHGRSVL